jgi:ectoine hydroxylase-related dioxygenase (phytanoyl-CoA dioxygenase family)
MAIASPSLPSLDSDYALSPEQVAQYRRDGHILLRGVLKPEEVAAFRDLFREAVAQRAANVAPLEKRDTYGKAFLQIMNLWEEDERYARFTLSRRFAKIAADLMGVEGVRLYHDQALYKEAGGGHTPWHQDQHYWPLATDNTITMWMPLIDASEEMGTMNFASGSHTLGYLGDMPISDESEAAWDKLISERGFTKVNHGAMKAGDATFHSGWTLHGAPGNKSDRTREVMTIIYYEDGTLVAPADNKNRQADLDRWIPGGVLGEPAASKLNPLVYRR